MSRHVAGSKAPATIVAFVFDQMSSNEFSQVSGVYLNQVQTAFAGASSAVSVEHSPPVLPALQAAAAANQFATVVLPASEATAARIKGESARLLVVTFDSTSDLAVKDAVMHAVLAVVAAKSQGDYVAVLTASTGQAVQLDFPMGAAPARTLLGHMELFGSAAAGAKAAPLVGPQYLTSNILLGLVIGAFMISVLAMGINVVTSIEAPVRFPRRNLVVKKEY